MSSDAATRRVVVAGAGAAGMATAITAARLNMSVTLVDPAMGPGGTVTGALIHTLGGIYDDRQQILNPGIVPELVERLSQASSLTRPRKIGKTWCLNVEPNVYRQVVDQWLHEESLIQMAWSKRVARVGTSGKTVHAVELAGPEGKSWSSVDAVVDCTGAAELVRLINPLLVFDDEERAAGGSIFRLRGVRPGAMAFPKGIAVVQRLRAAARAGTLPRLCEHAWIDQGVHEDEVYVKLFVPLMGSWQLAERSAEIACDTEHSRREIIAFLRQMPDFAAAEWIETGALGVRDGGRVKGDYYLTKDDVRSGQKFSDAACRCSWPIEYWHPERGLELEYLPDGAHYEIPLRSLKVRGIVNAWAAGKCLSADHRAQASARVVGQCWAMGQAVGRAVAEQALGRTPCSEIAEPVEVDSQMARPR